MKKSELFKELPAALAKFQAEVTNPKMTADNPHLKSKYAPLAEVFNTVRPILAKYGLSVLQDVYTEEDKAVIVTTIFHESGEWLESSPLCLPAGRLLKDGRLELTAQTIGSAISYGKRYQLQAAMGVAADQDTDGEDLRNEPIPLHVPNNLISKPSEATLKAKYQLVMQKLEGYEEYCQNLRDQGRDDQYISAALDKAYEMKKAKESAAS